ncbi:putative methylesterase 11, chloroplastic, partial [Hevea brasiliensis]|uniref:putative methylesterase 11, chloroplastic n=1 Tax=Hevea brasiliensis TaxID=3981 RepID=UPI0025F51BFA
GTFEVILLRKAELAYLAIWFGINAEGNSTSKRKAYHVFVWAFEFFLTVAHSFLYLLVQDIALASVSMRPIPFAPVLEKLCLSDVKYGTVRRFYIETAEDNAIPITLQESMINSSPPEKVFHLKGADHSPFFSKPQALHKILVEISKMPST